MNAPGAVRADGSAPPDPRRRVAVMSAAARCFRQYGVSKTTVDDIAAESGVSRATLYRTIPGGRDEIVLEVLLSEASEGFELIRAAVEVLPDFESQIVEGIALAIEGIRDDPNLAMLFTGESVTATVAIPGAWDALQRVTATLLEPFVDAARARGELVAGLSDEDVAEWVNRMIGSLLAFPGRIATSAEELRTYVRRFVVPALIAVPEART